MNTAAVQKAVKERFGVDLSAKETKQLQDYLDVGDRFSPGLLQEKRVVIDMHQEAVISADFKGQNARNLSETLGALARTDGMPLADRLKEVRAGEEVATASLEAKKARFREVTDKLYPGREAHFTGDDGMTFLNHAPTREEQERFVREWIKAGGDPGDLRLTSEPFRYQDTGKVIPGEKRSEIVVEAEGVGKKLRAELIAKMDREQLNDTQILVSLEAREKGPAQVHVSLLSTRELPPGVANDVTALTKKMGYDTGHVGVSDGLSRGMLQKISSVDPARTESRALALSAMGAGDATGSAAKGRSIQAKVFDGEILPPERPLSTSVRPQPRALDGMIIEGEVVKEGAKALPAPAAAAKAAAGEDNRVRWKDAFNMSVQVAASTNELQPSGDGEPEEASAERPSPAAPKSKADDRNPAGSSKPKVEEKGATKPGAQPGAKAGPAPGPKPQTKTETKPGPGAGPGPKPNPRRKRRRKLTRALTTTRGPIPSPRPRRRMAHRCRRTPDS